MERLLIAGAVIAIAVVVAVVLERRRPDAPWLVAVFTSATCDSCAKAVERAKVLASDSVAVDEAEVKARPDLHRRYHIDAVPTIVVADAEGVVRTSFTGPPSATDLWAAVAGVREGEPPSCG